METLIKLYDCCNCGEELTEDQLTACETDLYCSTCYDEKFCDCEDCCETIEISEAESHDGEYYCSDCFSNNFSSCDDCGDVVLNENTRSATNSRGHNVIICDDCYNNNYSTCYSCSNVYHDNDITNVSHRSYCHDCYGDNYTSCENCGEDIDRDYTCYDENSGYDYCQSCFNELHRKNSTIQKYSYKPTPTFFGKGNTFLGFELEVDKGTDKGETAEAIEHESYYFKEDGSLDTGFEIVSHPCSFEYLKDNKKHFEEIFKTLTTNGFRSFDTDTCGMHIHISKDSFTTWHLYRFLKFFKENKDFIVKISQRKLANLTQWANIDETDFCETSIIDKSKKKTTYGNRYQAINLNNSKTVEIRVFRGTLKLESFYKNIEFTQALFEFTQGTSTENISLANFKSFVFSRPQFKNLTSFIKTKNL